MIYQSRKALYDRMVSRFQTDLKDFKTVRLGDWKEVPIQEQPSIAIEWGGNMTFEEHTNPLECDWDLHICIKATVPMDPDEAAKVIELLLWSMSSTEDWGLLPFLRDNRSYQIEGTPYVVVMTAKQSEILIEGLPDRFFTANCITVVNCHTMR